MKHRVLGSTGLNVSEIGFGCWAIGGDRFGNSYGATDDDVSIMALKRAVELGVTFFDTADVYGHGHSEELLGKALKEQRRNVIIATKVGGDFYHRINRNFDPGYVRFALDQSLKRLGIDCIDLYQLHNPSLGQINEDTVAVFRDLQKEGLIKHWGISVLNADEGVHAIKTVKPEVIQVVYNVCYQEAAQELFALAKEANIGIIAREPLANGFLTGKYDEATEFRSGDIRKDVLDRQQVIAYTRTARRVRELLAERKESLTQLALKFVLHQEAVSVTIPGAKSPSQIAENTSASEIPSLQPSELARLRALQALAVKSGG